MASGPSCGDASVVVGPPARGAFITPPVVTTPIGWVVQYTCVASTARATGSGWAEASAVGVAPQKPCGTIEPSGPPPVITVVPSSRPVRPPQAPPTTANTARSVAIVSLGSKVGARDIAHGAYRFTGRRRRGEACGRRR